MSPSFNALSMVVATLLMLLAGLSKKRLEWKPPRDRKPRKTR
jgi:hypothetical protein